MDGKFQILPAKSHWQKTHCQVRKKEIQKNNEPFKLGKMELGFRFGEVNQELWPN